MKYISKKEQPIEFTQWKETQLQKTQDWKKLWRRFRRKTNVKQAIYQSLLEEQGYLCCYCGISIEIETSHIEHLQPRHTYPNLTLDYHNLLASCPGYDEQEMIDNQYKSKPEHCGHYKKDEVLSLSPLDEDCETYFSYDEKGNIFPIEEKDKKELANSTIERLGLNSSRLKRLREDAILGYLGDLEEVELTLQEINQLIEGLDKLDADGTYLEFCFAIKSILISQYL